MGYLLSFLAAIVWAIVPVLYRRGMDQFSAFGLGAVRSLGYVASAGLYVVATMGFSALKPASFAVMLPPMAAGVVWLVVGDLFYFVTLKKVGVTIGVPICSTYPLFVVPVSWLVLGEPLHASILAAAVLIVSGLILLSPRGDLHETRPKGFKAGLFFGILTISCWTVGIVTSKIFIRTIPIPQLEWWRSLAVLVVSWGTLPFFDSHWREELRRVSIVPILEAALAGALGLTVGDLLLSYSFRLIPVAIATCIASLRPFLAALFAIFILKEKVDGRLASGIALVVLGVLILSLF